LAALQARGAGLQLLHWHAGTPFETISVLLPHPAVAHFWPHFAANAVKLKSHTGKLERSGAQTLHVPS